MNNNYYYHNHDNNPNSYKSFSQLQEEIIMLKEKIEGNTRMLESVSIEQKSVLQNEIIEDQMRITDLEYEINRRRKEDVLMIVFCIFLIILIIFLLLALLNN